MSPSSSANTVSKPIAPPSSHSRHTSAASIKQQQSYQQQQPIPSKAPSPRLETKKSGVHYTCFIRLPFPRNGFEDPPPTEWDATKDRTLWKLVSKAANPSDLDWDGIADRLGVSKAFLFQQAAWLYDRHFEGMRKVMRMGAVPGHASSPVPAESGSSSVAAGQIGGVAMARLKDAFNYQHPQAGSRRCRRKRKSVSWHALVRQACDLAHAFNYNCDAEQTAGRQRR
ncbi:hypothetical protein B0A50_05476 [Salinomyces thailandicus]|uniref:Autophagy-related protein 29 n=1 Tax=Salinomyces thailandicus TaxID=706561 RepID=A0A4U0TUP5_9PEZI|nr:hypothetical protein B0A50_05476 [Salinomyces thailandica]